MTVTAMTKVVALWLMLAAFSGAAVAQTGSGAVPAAAGSAASDAPAALPPAPAAPASDARKACTEAMNADPLFAAAIVKTADEKAAAQRDADTLAAHSDANLHVQKNERHVIYGYASMWIVAALFVIFLWRRQQALKSEIANLRRDLEAAAADDAATEKARS